MKLDTQHDPWLRTYAVKCTSSPSGLEEIQLGSVCAIIGPWVPEDRRKWIDMTLDSILIARRKDGSAVYFFENLSAEGRVSVKRATLDFEIIASGRLNVSELQVNCHPQFLTRLPHWARLKLEAASPTVPNERPWHNASPTRSMATEAFYDVEDE